ncbi:hypothetical protein [Aquisphaera giovannonii]|nr:hypothetical protein [Aquisphaera giovannonii]
MMVAIASLAAGGRMVDSPVDLPRGGLRGMGRIAAVRQGGMNRWAIDMDDGQVLREDPTPAAGRGGAGSKMTVDLATGLGGLMASPSDGWIGRTALFVGTRRDGRLASPRRNLPLAPDGSSFFVFGPGPDRRPGAVRRLVEVSATADLERRSDQLGRYAGDWSEPPYLRALAVDRLAKIGDPDSPLRRSSRERLYRWRDDRSSPLELRFAADHALVDTSPPDNQWSERRMASLAAVRDDPDSPKERAALARRLIDDAEAMRGDPPR